MLIRKSLVGLAASTMLLACSSVEAPMTENELVVLNDTIVGVMNGYTDALMSLDPEVITAFYADDPTFRIYLDGQRVTRDELVAQVNGMPSALRSLHAAWENIEVTPLGRDAALGAARFERVVVDIAGDTLRDWGAATWVWVRQEEGWRLIHGHGVHYPGTLP